MQTRRIHVAVQHKREAQAIERALRDPDVKAFVIVCGVLNELPSPSARARVLRYAAELCNDPDYQSAIAAAREPLTERHAPASREGVES